MRTPYSEINIETKNATSWTKKIGNTILFYVCHKQEKHNCTDYLMWGYCGIKGTNET